jgi:magnesium and cobalt transporter
VAREHSPPEPEGWFRQLLRRFSLRVQTNGAEDLQDLIDASEQQGIIGAQEGNMLQSILELDETILRETMVPRTAMVCVSAAAPMSEVLQTILDSGHSRIPIYQGNIDNIIGLVYAKDLLRFWGQSLDNLVMEDILRAPYLVPESKRASELLKEFRETRVHIAIVIDEYGGTSGLVTIEDLLEEIVGDIQDEYDREEECLIKQDDGTMLVDGRLDVEDFEDYFAVEVARDKFDTVGGYIVEQLGRVPTVGEKVQIDQFEMLIEKGDQRAVRLIRVYPPAAAEAGVGE